MNSSKYKILSIIEIFEKLAAFIICFHQKLAELKQKKKDRKQRWKEKGSVSQQKGKQQSESRSGCYIPRTKRQEHQPEPASVVTWLTSLLPESFQQASESISSYVKSLWNDDESAATGDGGKTKAKKETEKTKQQKVHVNDTGDDHDVVPPLKDCRQMSQKQKKKVVAKKTEKSDRRNRSGLKTQPRKTSGKSEATKLLRMEISRV